MHVGASHPEGSRIASSTLLRGEGVGGEGPRCLHVLRSDVTRPRDGDLQAQVAITQHDKHGHDSGMLAIGRSVGSATVPPHWVVPRSQLGALARIPWR